MNCREMIGQKLIEGKYDGLFDENTGCACVLSDLLNCAEGYAECEAGMYKDCEMCEDKGKCGFNFCMCRKEDTNGKKTL